MTEYFQPVIETHRARPSGAMSIGWGWFDRVLIHRRGAAPRLGDTRDVPSDVMTRLTQDRTSVAGLTMDCPRVMGILNVTPDSFSDGGKFNAPDAALARARQMIDQGADILDIGGESTRPGAQEVEIAEEIDRTAPIVAAIRAGSAVPISIDTRKAPVAHAALEAGANLVNDVSAMTFDPALGQVAAQSGAPICLMHAQGSPETMQNDPRYDDVLLDVYDYLSQRVTAATEMGIPRNQIIVDPGIGFGKTMDHNLALLRGLSLLHGLGCPILLGASRKRFIGTIGAAPEASDRVAGSVAVALYGVAAGVQLLRVHDTFETRQALSLQMAMN